MFVEETSRLVCKSEMNIVNGFPESSRVEDRVINILDLSNLKPATGMEFGFMFYEKLTGAEVCHIHFEGKRREYEVSYGTNDEFRGNGYMKEALAFFIAWIFKNTEVDTLVALINNNASSRHILEITGFTFEGKDEYGDWFIIKK